MLILVVVASVSGQAIVVGAGLAGMSLKGGAKKPQLAKLLCENSGADVGWLLDKFNLDLSLVVRRTQRGKERFPGFTLTYALIQVVGKIGEKTDKAKIKTKARATELIMSLQ